MARIKVGYTLRTRVLAILDGIPMMTIGVKEAGGREVMIWGNRDRHLKRIRGHQMIHKDRIRAGAGETTMVEAAAEVVVVEVIGEIGSKHLIKTGEITLLKQANQTNCAAVYLSI